MMERWAMFAFFMIIISATTSVMAQTPAKNFKFIDPANMDISVKPGDNFYLYANGAWIKNNRCQPPKHGGEVLMRCGKPV
jgi:putative endopeptidase